LQRLERLILVKYEEGLEIYEGVFKGNRITAIPQEIFELINLKELRISYNQITEIPDAIAQLANLTTLSLHSN
jgi:internalin A